MRDWHAMGYEVAHRQAMRERDARRVQPGGPWRPRAALSSLFRAWANRMAPSASKTTVAVEAERLVKGMVAVAAGLALQLCGPALGQATLQVAEHPALGPYLTNGEGRTVYLFLEDEGASSCAGVCARLWAPLLVTGEPVAGKGVDAALLGTVAREDGGMQVSYAGHPLYLRAADQEPGSIVGQGDQGVWFAVTPAGQPAEERVAPLAATIPVGLEPFRHPVAAVGSIWVPNLGDGTVSRIDPDSDEVAATSSGYWAANEITFSPPNE